jgi:hypothetical protein
MSKYVVESQEQQIAPYKRLVTFTAFIVVVLAVLAFRCDARVESHDEVGRVATSSIGRGWLESKLALARPDPIEHRHGHCRVTFKPVGD